MTLPGLLLDATIKISIIVMIALAATALLHRRSAALRHWVLAAALVCAAVTPLLQFIVPAWDVRSTDPIVVLATLSETANSAGRTTTLPPASAMTPGQVLGWMWLIGAAISLGVVLVGLGRLAWLASRSRPVVDATWTGVVHDIASRYGIYRPIVLLQSDHPTLLVTWGLAVPKIILPAAARHWTSDRVRIVVGHELAHIQRRDWVVHIAAEVLRSVYWFNPLVWIACVRLRRESEHACDDAVLNLGVEGTDYATQLVDLARTFNAYGRSWFPGSPAPAMARRSTLERRIRAMLTSDQNRTPISRLAGAAIVIALLAVTIPIAGFGAAPQSGPLTFSGRLLDTIGHILPDQLIVLTHSVTKATHEGRSDASGYFTFSGLEAGDYDIDVRVPGFAPRYRVSLPPGQTLQRDITLQLGSLMETITVVKSSGPSAPRRPAGDLPPLYVHEPGPCDQSPKGGCIEQPTKIGDKKPGYPENRTEPEVTVILECRIGTDGVPKRISAVGPADPEFARAAADAVAQWRFTPTYLDGVALEVDMRVIVHFRAE